MAKTKYVKIENNDDSDKGFRSKGSVVIAPRRSTSYHEIDDYTLPARGLAKVKITTLTEDEFLAALEMNEPELPLDDEPEPEDDGKSPKSAKK